jgi:hypothetical protein
MSTFEVRGRYDQYTVESVPASKGGVGSIHRTTDPRWVYKQYFESAKAPSLQHLDRLTGIGRDVLIRDGRKPGETPESSVNWPVDVSVDADEAVQGVILPAIPPSLFNEYDSVRGLEFLVMARANPPSAKGRVALLLRMAEILNFIDSRGLVHGDINGKNLAWAMTPAPIMYLIDCDGMVPQDPPPDQGVQAMGWTDPRVIDHLIPAHDKYSDWYCLALAMYRGLLLTSGKLDSKRPDGSWPEPRAIPAGLDPVIAALLRRGLCDPLDPAARPRPAEWVKGLISAYLDHGRFDDAATQKLDQLSVVARAKPTFTTLPSTDWSQFLPSTSASQPPQPAPPHWAPPQPAPPQQVPVWPQPASPVRPAVPSRPVPTVPAPPVCPLPPSSRLAPQVGGLAARAIEGGTGWHLRGLLCALFLPAIALGYIGVALYQLRDLYDRYPVAAVRRNALCVYAAIAVIPFFLDLIFIARK